MGEGKNAASLKQIRAALSFAYKHWDLKNPFAKIEPPLHKEPQIRYLLLSDISAGSSIISKSGSRDMARLSLSTWPTPSFKLPAGSMSVAAAFSR